MSESEPEMAQTVLNWAKRFIINGEKSIQRIQKELEELGTKERIAQAVLTERQKWEDNYDSFGFGPRFGGDTIEDEKKRKYIELETAKRNLDNSKTYLAFLEQVLNPYINENQS